MNIENLPEISQDDSRQDQPYSSPVDKEKSSPAKRKYWELIQEDTKDHNNKANFIDEEYDKKRQKDNKGEKLGASPNSSDPQSLVQLPSSDGIESRINDTTKPKPDVSHVRHRRMESRVVFSLSLEELAQLQSLPPPVTTLFSYSDLPNPIIDTEARWPKESRGAGSQECNEEPRHASTVFVEKDDKEE